MDTQITGIEYYEVPAHQSNYNKGRKQPIQVHCGTLYSK